MATCPEESLRALCRRRVARRLATLSGPALAPRAAEISEQVYAVARANLASGRYARLACHRLTPRGMTRARYIDRIVDYWLSEHARVARLDCHEPGEWQRLCAELTRRAARLLSRYRPRSSAAEAQDFAQRACEQIDRSRYPFDVPFDAWAATILHHLVFEAARSRDALDQGHDSLEGPPGIDADRAPARLSSELADRSAAYWHERIENRDALDRILARMSSPIQRQVIILTFFEELDDVEIARRLVRTRANVQTLRHRGLAQLAKLLRAAEVKETHRRKHQED